MKLSKYIIISYVINIMGNIILKILKLKFIWRDIYINKIDNLCIYYI